MKFTAAGSKIICSRVDNTVENRTTYRQVVDFDAHVESVPPHVAAKLTQGEIEELEYFLEDRRRIQADPADINMLEALPELIEEVTDALYSANQLNEAIYKRLFASVERLTAALNSVRPRAGNGTRRMQGMRPSEVLKERLKIIKKDL
jgi:hypothetical protein